jgi:HSP20 family protein
VRLPTEVDAGRVEAELRNGVLTITLPKSEKAKPRRITVAAAS